MKKSRLKITTLTAALLILWGSSAWATLAQFDFGDAPESYTTLLGDDGARHMIFGISNLLLGSAIDAEEDGQPNGSASGDDFSNLNDDDGIGFTTPLVQGKTAGISVLANGSAFLSAWIDFNQDGAWDDPGEQIFTDQAITGGTNNLVFDIPAAALLGSTYARFRASTESGLGFYGIAFDGEVEDYMVTITDTPVPVPSSILLLGFGLLGLFGIRKESR